MNWKSTTFVSGAGLLATWLASVPAPSTLQQATAPRAAAPQAQPQTALSSEIIHEADRLERRNQTGTAFNHPARNLFRFGQVRSGDRRATPVVAAPVIEVAPEPPAFAVHLSGVARDQVDGKDVWTAILSTPTGVVLAHTGDPLAAGWTVATIEAESVELTRPDGSILIVPLSGK